MYQKMGGYQVQGIPKGMDEPQILSQEDGSEETELTM